MAVYFFYGDEDFNIELELNLMRSKLNKDFGGINYQQYDNPTYPNLINALRTQPMMFGNMLIVINANSYFFRHNNKEIKFEDKELEDIENALNNNPDSLDIVFVVELPRDENKKLDSRKKLYKILTKFNSQEFQTFKTYKTAEIATWIKHRAKSKDFSLKEDAIELLIEQIGNNLRQFDAELDKLKLIAHPGKVATKEMVKDIAISNQDLFNLTEMLLNGKKDKALLEFKKLVDKKYPLEILSAIQTFLRKWIILKTKSQTHSPAELSKLTGQHEFVVKQTLHKLKSTKIVDLVNLKNNLYNAEYKIKAGEALDIVSEVEYALIK